MLQFALKNVGASDRGQRRTNLRYRLVEQTVRRLLVEEKEGEGITALPKEQQRKQNVNADPAASIVNRAKSKLEAGYIGKAASILRQAMHRTFPIPLSSKC